MKKIGKLLVRLFRQIGLFFDKVLITPITKLIIRFMDLSKNAAKSLDRLSGKKSTLLIVSLILSFIVFIYIDNE